MNGLTKFIAAAVFTLLPTVGLATVVSFEVDAKLHSSNMMNGLQTGIFFNEGDGFTVSAELNDMWFLGGSTTTYTNADGLQDYPNYPQNNLSTAYGMLVGRIGEGDFFEIGTRFVGVAQNAGQLILYNWDSGNSENLDSITATVHYEAAEAFSTVTSVPVPATGWLLVAGLAGFGLIRRG